MGNSGEGSGEGAVYQEMMDCAGVHNVTTRRPRESSQSRAAYRAKRVSLHCSTAVTAKSVHIPFLNAASARFLREARRV